MSQKGFFFTLTQPVDQRSNISTEMTNNEIENKSKQNLNLLMYIGNHNKNPSSLIHDERSQRMTKGSNAKLCGFSIRKSEYPYFI